MVRSYFWMKLNIFGFSTFTVINLIETNLATKASASTAATLIIRLMNVSTSNSQILYGI